MASRLLDWLKKEDAKLAAKWTKIMGDYDPANLVLLTDVANPDDLESVSLEDVRRIIDNLAWFVDVGGNVYVDADQLVQENEEDYFDWVDVESAKEMAVLVTSVQVKFVHPQDRDWSVNQGFHVTTNS